MYFVFYGIMMELGLLIARYKRHDSSHDESHAGLMVMSFVIALIADVWYVLANLDNLFTGFWNQLRFWFIVGVSALFFIQLCKHAHR